MKGISGIFVVLMVVTLLGSGCNGRNKIIPFGKSSFDSRYERSVEQVRTATFNVLGNMGQLTLNDTVNNVIEAKVDRYNVMVLIFAEDSGITRVTTSVRSNAGVGNLNLAREIDKRIALELPRYQSSGALPNTIQLQ